MTARLPQLGRAHLAIPVTILVLLGAVAPLVVLFIFSVFEVEEFDLVPAFSGRAWVELLTTASYWVLIGRALIYGASTAAFTALLGYPIALALARLPASLKGIAVVMLLTPLYPGEIVRIYAWRIVLGAEGLVNALLEGVGLIDEPLKVLLFSPLTIVIVLVYNNLPFMVLAIWVSAEMVDRRLIEAANAAVSAP